MSPVRDKLPPLGDDEKELVHDAIRRANALPADLPTEEHVNKLLKIRVQLERDVLALADPVKRSHPWLIAGWATTLPLTTIVMVIGFWRAFARYDAPIAGIDDPLSFLGWFTLAFLASWLPLLLGWFKARAVRKRIEASEVPDPEPALTYYDLASVRHLLKQESQS